MTHTFIHESTLTASECAHNFKCLRNLKKVKFFNHNCSSICPVQRYIPGYGLYVNYRADKKCKHKIDIGENYTICGCERVIWVRLGFIIPNCLEKRSQDL